MSRSRKKVPILKFCPSSKRGSAVKRIKREASKAVRRYTLDIPDGVFYRKLYCSWNIHDWIYYFPEEDESYRK